MGHPLGSAEVSRFSDGEIFVKINENIRGTDVFIIQSIHPPASNLMELLVMIDAAKRASASRVTAVIPYYGYARQDRKDQPRVSITAKLVANLLTTAGANRVLTMDLHSPQIQGFFDIPLDHLYSSQVFTGYFKSLNLSDLVVVSPDIGSVRMARSYAKRLEVDLALVDKRRPQPNEAEVMTIIGNVGGKNIMIRDDMVDTGGTIIQAADALKAKGAGDIYAACTHPVLSGDSVGRIEKSEISKLVVANTIPIPEDKLNDKIEILSVAGVFGEAIRRIYCGESVSALFD